MVMEETVTRQSLAEALVDILAGKGVSEPREAIEVIGSPGNGTRLFVIVAAPRARTPLGEELMRVIGHRHPNAGDVWVLNEAQSVTLTQLAAKASGGLRAPR